MTQIMAQQHSLERLFDMMDYLIDERVGVVRHLIEVKRDAGAPNLFSFYARACDVSALCSQRNFPDAGGASSDRQLAMAKAVGEAVERYCAAFYDPQALPFYSYGTAPFLCIPPDRFALYSRKQHQQNDFPYARFDHNTPIRWTPTIDLTTCTEHFVPAATVYVPYLYDKALGEAPIMQSISTGAACHCSRSEASVSAICEVIERDGFMIAWQARLSMPHILIETLSDKNRDLVARYERTGASVNILNITMDHGIPTILSVLRNKQSDAPAFVFAAAAHLDPEQAVRKSLEELALTRRLAQELKMQMPCIDATNFENVTNQDGHIRLFCEQTSAPYAEFIFSSTKFTAFEEIPNFSQGSPDLDLKVLVEKINAIDFQVLLADLTTPDIRDLGLYVARAIIPGFHPLFFGHRVRALGGDRLWSVPQSLGYEGIKRESGDNPVPHPYP